MHQAQAEVVPGLRLRGGDGDGIAEHRVGFRDPALLVNVLAEVVPGHPSARIAAERVGPQRLVVTEGAHPHDRQERQQREHCRARDPPEPGLETFESRHRAGQAHAQQGQRRGAGVIEEVTAFAQFLDVAAFSNSETLNYSNIARDCHVDAKTIKEYYQVLVDTLLGYYIYPYKNKIKREDLVATPKFYFFDVGVVNRLL